MLRTLATLAGLATMLTLTGCTGSTAADDIMRDAPGNDAALGDNPPPRPAAPAATTLTWGKRFTWPGGLAVELSAPAGCKPDKYAMPGNIRRAVRFTVSIINGTDKPFDTSVLSYGVDAQFAGKRAENVYDSNGGCGAGSPGATTVMPGKTFTYEITYSVGPAPGEMQLIFEPEFGAEQAVFVGQA